MEYDPVTKRVKRTAQEMAEHTAIHERFKGKPTIEELVRSGELTGKPVPHGMYLELRALLHDLKEVREAAGLSLTDVAERSGIDPAALSRLENGRVLNPTLDTLHRYAAALDKSLVLGVVNVPKRKKARAR